MKSRLNECLPKKQILVIRDPMLWVKIRLTAERNHITLSELVEIGMRKLVDDEDCDLIVTIGRD